MYLYDIGRAEYYLIIDVEVMVVFFLLCCIEGIILVIEFVHALAGAQKLGREFGLDVVIFVNFFGCGDKDVEMVLKYFGLVQS